MFKAVSAKSGEGIEDAMMDLTKAIDLNYNDEEQNSDDKLGKNDLRSTLFGDENCC